MTSQPLLGVCPSVQKSDAPPLLLDDAAMRKFVVDGFHTVTPEAMPSLTASFHERITEKLVQMFDEESTRPAVRDKMLDSLLQEVPDLLQLFADPGVAGALTSILGDDWSLHS